MKAINLRTEYLKNPLVIGQTRPHFSWNCEDGITQTAYEIIVKRDNEIYWDSGKVPSSNMTGICYGGKELKSRDELDWQVLLWDENDKKGDPSEGKFGIGLLQKDDWSAKWISGGYKPVSNKRYPVDLFLKEFKLSGLKIKKARLYASARGIYDVVINEHRLEDFIFAPGVTDYRKRIQYQVYDVTSLLKNENVLKMRLADGWFRGSVAAYGVTGVFGNQTSIIAQLEVEYEDGKIYTLATDESFKWSNDGEILFADLKDGEIVDANNSPSYAHKAKVVKCDVPLVCSDNVPVTEHEHFVPRITISETGEKILDFGQNISGYLSFDITAKKGQKIHLTMGETLDERGNLDLSGIQESKPLKGWNQLSLITKLMGKPIHGETVMTPLQEISYICREGVNKYKTSFAVFGFRYARVETDIDIKPEDFESIAVYSDLEQTGDFECSNEMINRLLENTRWSMKGNYLDVPTDCPTRERLGWTGDAQIFFDTGSYLMNTAPFFRKWLKDMEDDQYPNGLIPAVVPYQGVEMMYKATGSSVGWADAIYLVPYRFYKKYGDKELLKYYWPMIKKYSDYLLSHLGFEDKKIAKDYSFGRYIYEKGMHLGEWLEPDEFRDKSYGVSQKHTEECTAYFHYAMKVIAEIAEIAGDTKYSKECKEYADGSKKAYKELIVDKGLLDTNRQAKLVRPLALGLLDGEANEYACKRLTKAIEDYDYCVGTGFLSTPFILPVLSEAGHSEVAYRMLQNTKSPSWLSEVKQGATTIWESWEGDASRNHYSPGAVCQWLFDTVTGIRVDGPRHFIIKPIPGGELSFAGASYISIYGKVESRWNVEDAEISFEISVPSNTTATVLLPDGRVEDVSAGRHGFKCSNI